MTKLWQRPPSVKSEGDIALGEFPEYAYSKMTDMLKQRSQVTAPKEKRWFMKIACVHALSSKIRAFCHPKAIKFTIQAILTTRSLTKSSRPLFLPYSELAKPKEDVTNTFHRKRLQILGFHYEYPLCSHLVRYHTSTPV